MQNLRRQYMKTSFGILDPSPTSGYNEGWSWRKKRERIILDKVSVFTWRTWPQILEMVDTDQACAWEHLKTGIVTDWYQRSGCIEKAVNLRIFQGKYIGNSGENAGWSRSDLKGFGFTSVLGRAMGALQRESLWNGLPKTGDFGWTCKQLAGRGIANVLGTAGEISTMGTLQGTTKGPLRKQESALHICWD